VNAYKDTIDTFFDGWEVHCNIDSFGETNCHIDSFDAFTPLLNTYPPQYIKYAEKEFIEKDATGRWCARFARYVAGADVPLLQQTVIEKDPTGEWCYWLRLSHQEENLMEELSL
jgi:hypothetical protein